MAKQLTIGWRSLRYVCPTLSKSTAQKLSPQLARAMERYHINTPLRAAMFIAQVAHESGEFRYREEIWGPTTAQKRYDPSSGSSVSRALGNVVKGDGYKYRGRGYIQITGRANYTALSRSWNEDRKYVENPGLIANYTNAARSAAWWWERHGLNQIAERKDILRSTRVINGGTNGLAERKKYYARALRYRRWLEPKYR